MSVAPVPPGMDRHGSLVRIALLDEGAQRQHPRDPLRLAGLIQVVLAADEPRHGMSAITGDEVSPDELPVFQRVPLDLPSHAHDRHQARIVGIVEVAIDRRPEVDVPAESTARRDQGIKTRRPALPQEGHVDHGEPLLAPLVDQGLEHGRAVGPRRGVDGHLIARTEPPGVAQPKEGLSVAVRQVVPVGRDLKDPAVSIERIVAGGRRDGEGTCLARQAGIRRIAIDPIGPAAGSCRHESHLPGVAPVPVSVDSERLMVRAGELDG